MLWSMFSTMHRPRPPASHWWVCSPSSTRWAKKVLRSRWAYADAVIANLIADASALNTAWQGYSAVIESAGTDGSAFDKERCPLDQVAAAMFYVDQQVKDAKLAIPGGLSPDCENDNCPERVEHPWANARENH